MEPKRIQRKREKGWRKPPNTIYVGRPSKWGNVSEKKGLQAIIEFIIYQLLTNPFLVEEIRSELKGHNLMCWCKLGNVCHADVLLWIANQKEPKVSCPFTTTEGVGLFYA